MSTTVLNGVLCRVWLLLPSCIRLFTYRCLVDIGVRFHGRTSSTRTYRLPFSLYAKYGDNVLESEANVMRFLAEHTAVVLPRVIDCIKIPTGAFIVMTRLPGESLMDKIDYMTTNERAQFVRDLGSSLQQLHALSAPDSRVSAFGGGPFRDWRIHEHGSEGPFDSEKEFYDHLYNRVPMEYRSELREIAREVHSQPHQLCLTHNDLNLHNILVHNNRFSGLVDWECAAWLPECWEYTRSMYLRLGYQEWVDVMNMAHPQIYPKELEIEKQFWLRHCPW